METKNLHPCYVKLGNCDVIKVSLCEKHSRFSDDNYLIKEIKTQEIIVF